MTAGPIQTAQSLIGRRPAETATAAAGALGLLLASVIDGGNNDLQTGLVVILATLPAVVSYVHDLGKSRDFPHDLGREIEELALRAVRRARLGDDGWKTDTAAAVEFAKLSKSIAPTRQQTSSSTDESTTTEDQG